VDGRERAQLVERNLDLVRRAAAILHPRVRDHVALDELVALGNAGLAEAASRYEPERGVAFPAFAWYRVNGAMIDGLRQATQLPRRTWAKLIALRAASDYLENRAERERGAIERSGAAVAGDPGDARDALSRVQHALSAIRTMYMTSLETMRDGGFDLPAEASVVADRIDGARLAARLRAALTRLSDKERALVTKHYWEGKNLARAGAELGMSKSWASRLHAQAVDKLRAAVDGDR
jgi:RNA polymerase sigma factor for flagellar operon FliA